MRFERALPLAAATLASVGALAAPPGRGATAIVRVEVGRDLDGGTADRTTMGTAVHPGPPSPAVGGSSSPIAGWTVAHHRAAAWDLAAPRVWRAPQPPTGCRAHRSPGSGRASRHLLASETGGRMVGDDALSSTRGSPLGGSDAVRWASIHGCSPDAARLMTADRR